MRDSAGLAAGVRVAGFDGIYWQGERDRGEFARVGGAMMSGTTGGASSSPTSSRKGGAECT